MRRTAPTHVLLAAGAVAVAVALFAAMAVWIFPQWGSPEGAREPLRPGDETRETPDAHVESTPLEKLSQDPSGNKTIYAGGGDKATRPEFLGMLESNLTYSERSRVRMALQRWTRTSGLDLRACLMSDLLLEQGTELRLEYLIESVPGAVGMMERVKIREARLSIHALPAQEVSCMQAQLDELRDRELEIPRLGRSIRERVSIAISIAPLRDATQAITTE